MLNDDRKDTLKNAHAGQIFYGDVAAQLISHFCSLKEMGPCRTVWTCTFVIIFKFVLLDH